MARATTMHSTAEIADSSVRTVLVLSLTFIWRTIGITIDAPVPATILPSRNDDIHSVSAMKWAVTAAIVIESRNE